jgi:hypothetical protein
LRRNGRGQGVGVQNLRAAVALQHLVARVKEGDGGKSAWLCDSPAAADLSVSLGNDRLMNVGTML